MEEAVKRAVTIETALTDSHEFDNFLDDDNFGSKDDVSIVHKAAIILRNRILESTQATDKEDNSDEVDHKVVAIGSDITALIAPDRFTPKQLGLSVYLHYTFGSKKLIEDLNVLGHTLIYSEVRWFLTSAALYMSTSQTRTQSGAPMSSQGKTLVLSWYLLLITGITMSTL